MEKSEKKGVMRRLVLLAPFLVAVIPVLNLWKKNMGQVTIEVVAVPLLMAMLVTAVVFGLLMLLMRDRYKAVCMASLVMVLFSFFGYAFNVLWVYNWIEGYNMLYGFLGTLMLVYIALIGLVVWKKNNLEPFARFLFVVSLVLCVVPSFKIAKVYGSNMGRGQVDRKSTDEVRPPLLTTESEDRPDIYYIILDGYARQDSLLKHFEYDNSQFVQGLRDRGFYVADQSTCNYPMTFVSLPSTLNMKYMHEDMERIGRYDLDQIPMYKMIHDNKVGRFLQNKGYQYVTVNTQWGGTEKSDIADIEMDLSPYGLKGEFALAYANSTAARILLPSVADMHHFAFSAVERASNISGPTFTFSHMILPHQPFVFDADGNERKNVPMSFQITDIYKGDRIKQMYVEQLKYTNKRVLGLIDHLVEQSEQTPVIILQADHGSGSGGPRPFSVSHQGIEYDPFIKERHAILNAMLVPQKVKEKLYPQISSVNTFRVLFSEMFGADYPLLKDENYYSWYRRPYNVRDVTELVGSKREQEENGNSDVVEAENVSVK